MGNNLGSVNTTESGTKKGSEIEVVKKWASFIILIIGFGNSFYTRIAELESSDKIIKADIVRIDNSIKELKDEMKHSVERINQKIEILIRKN